MLFYSRETIMLLIYVFPKFINQVKKIYLNKFLKINSNNRCWSEKNKDVIILRIYSWEVFFYAFAFLWATKACFSIMLAPTINIHLWKITSQNLLKLGSLKPFKSSSQSMECVMYDFLLKTYYVRFTKVWKHFWSV